MSDARDVDARSLRLLAAVAATGSIGGAADEVGMSQQAASRRISELERRVGVVLLARSAHGSSLTDAGRLVVGWATEVLAAHTRLELGLASLRDDGTGVLRIAASLTIAEHLVPSWILRHRVEHGVQVDLRVGNSSLVADLVRAGEVEVGFIETPGTPDDLDVVALWQDELVLVVAPSHPWTARAVPVSAQELAATPLVVREEGSGTREALVRILADRGAAPPAAPTIELSTAAAVRAAIADGVAPGVLSHLAVDDDVRLGRLVIVPTEGAPMRRPLTAVLRRGVAAPEVRAFLAVVTGR